MNNYISCVRIEVRNGKGGAASVEISRDSTCECKPAPETIDLGAIIKALAAAVYSDD